MAQVRGQGRGRHRRLTAVLAGRLLLAFGRAARTRRAVTCTRQRRAAEEVVAASQQMGSTGQVLPA